MRIKKWINTLRLYGITDEDIENQKDILTNKFGKEASMNDVIWNLFVKLTARIKDLSDLKGLFYNKALFLNEEGRDCTTQLQQVAKFELMILKRDGLVNKVKICSSIGCEECKKMDGKVFIIEEALKLMPIPCKNCTYELFKGRKGFCRCCYVPFFE